VGRGVPAFWLSNASSNADDRSLNKVSLLQPQNIMFTAEESNNLKLIDFGLARKLNAEKDLKILFGTPEFVGNCASYELYVY
jgi:hypothetical protein